MSPVASRRSERCRVRGFRTEMELVRMAAADAQTAREPRGVDGVWTTRSGPHGVDWSKKGERPARLVSTRGTLRDPRRLAARVQRGQDGWSNDSRSLDRSLEPVYRAVPGARRAFGFLTGTCGAGSMGYEAPTVRVACVDRSHHRACSLDAPFSSFGSEMFPEQRSRPAYGERLADCVWSCATTCSQPTQLTMLRQFRLAYHLAEVG